MDTKDFSVILDKMIEEESESLKCILAPLSGAEKWKADARFAAELKILVEALCDRFVHRASLFGQYRSDPDMLKTDKKRTRPPPMECREADFNLAWQTLEQDTK
jgi:hypothetical protein